MKKQLFSLLFLISLLVGVSAQATKQFAPKPDVIEQNLRRHVTYLASDRLEGRRTGERGATFAAGYVANMFSNFRLKGGFVEIKNGKSRANFLQPFPFVTGVETAKDGNEFRFTIESASGQNLAPGNVAVWKPAGFSSNADVSETPVVFANYGIVSDEARRDDYANLDVRNKIVLVFDGAPDGANPHSPFARFDARTKAKIARDKGAKGLFIITREAKVETDALAQMKYDQTLGESAVPTIIVSRTTAASILGTDEKGLKDAENGTTLTNLPAVQTAFKINLVKQQNEGYNVIGVLDGTDPQLKNEAIIIGAHYDHLGRGGQGSLAANSTEIHHGADDNASGVAGLVELARQFSQSKKNKRTIIFISFGGEEEGLIGSKFYVSNPVFPLAKTAAMINMDMIGRLKDNKLTIGGIGTASEWKNLVEETNSQGMGNQKESENPSMKSAIENALKAKNICCVYAEANKDEVILRGMVRKGKFVEAITTSMEVAKMKIVNQVTEGDSNLNPMSFREPFLLSLNQDGFGPSDHSSFYGKQIPVLFFFTGTHLDYHKPSDTADKINYAGLNQVVGYVSEIVKAIDGNPKRPTYTVAKSSGTGEGRRGFNVSLGTIPSYADATDGLVLDGVRDDSPAAKTGLKAGDKIIKLAGKEVRNVSDYTIILGEMKPETEYEIVIVRGGQMLNLKIVPATRK